MCLEAAGTRTAFVVLESSSHAATAEHVLTPGGSVIFPAVAVEGKCSTMNTMNSVLIL